MKSIPVTVTPLVYPAGEVSAVRIHAESPRARNTLNGTGQIRVLRVHSHLDERRRSYVDDQPVPFNRLENGDLEFTQLFPKEDEYSIELRKEVSGTWQQICRLQVYALEKDLFELRPYRGDFHLHSTRSDGNQEPEYVASTGRKCGFDFMALTDHYRYAPSLEVMKFVQKVNPDYKCFPGEEVHPPENPVHIVNFGGSCSINDMISADKEAFEAESAELAKELDSSLHDLTREQAAKSEWCFEKIKEAGGIAVFSHPFWRPGHGNVFGKNMPGLHNYIGDEVMEVLLERKKFDAMELFAGYPAGEEESHHLGMALYQRELVKRQGDFPAIGVSDSHDCDGELFNWCSTVVFAKSPDFPGIAEGIRSCSSVALLTLPGNDPWIAGPYRLTKFTHFLLRTFYPIHDELCRIEGELMLLIHAGNTEAQKALDQRKDSVPALFRTLWK